MRRLVTSAVVVLWAASAGASAHAADACPNAAYRAGAGANLPECRAWEQASPRDKNGINVSPFAAVRATDARAVYVAAGAFPQADSAVYTGLYASARGDGWSTRGIDPPLRSDSSPRSVLLQEGTEAVSDDLLSAVMVSSRPLTPGAVEGDSNVYLRDLRDGSFRLLFTRPGTFTVADSPLSVLFGGTPDDRRLTLTTTIPLTPDGVEGRTTIYSWQDGVLRLESKLPDGQQAGDGTTPVSLSTDGRRITFIANLGGAPVLLQRVGDTTTVVSESERQGRQGTPVGANSPLVSPDGRTITFLSAGPDPLTDESPTGVVNSRQYRWTADDGRLVDVLAGVTSADAGTTALSQSPDGRYLWFTSSEALTDDAPAGQPSLYVLDTRAGRLSLAAPGSSGGLYSPNGAVTLLRSEDPLTPGAAAGQLYSFDAARPGAGVTCVSCGAPGASAIGTIGFQDRAITDDGRAFFDSTDRLVAADANDLADVYQYTPGAGLSLLSSGTGDQPAKFAGIGPSGEDAFLLTATPLVGQDVDTLIDLYDVRIGGGIAAQQTAPASPGCSGDGCRASAAPPSGLRASAPAGARPAAPSFSLRTPSAAARRRAARTGRLAVAVRVSTAGKVTLRARARAGGRARTVASGSRTARRAGTVSVALRLSESARRRLRRRGTLSLALTARFSRVSATQSVRVTLERASARKKGGSR